MGVVLRCTCPVWLVQASHNCLLVSHCTLLSQPSMTVSSCQTKNFNTCCDRNQCMDHPCHQNHHVYHTYKLTCTTWTCNDGDDCQSVDHLADIHGKAMLVAYTGAVSLPVDKQWKTHTEKKMKETNDGAITGLKTSVSWDLSFLRKAEEDSDSLSTWGRAFQSLGAELEKANNWLLKCIVLVTC